MLHITLIVLTAVTTPPPATASSPNAYQRVALCSVLETIRPGEVLPVVVTGVLEVDYEFAVFFDPEQPICTKDVQPDTWVEFAPTIGPHHELDALLKKSRRAAVTFKGQLYGPGVVLPDDPALPFAAAFANRVAHRRYGHFNLYRTKLLVEAILAVAEAPATSPRPNRQQPPSPRLPSPIHLDVPQYSLLARQLGIMGDVIVAVTVEDGRVTATHVKSGDRVLVTDTIANIRSWQFPRGTNASFTTTFTYQLESQKAGDDQPRIELRLPESVRITAPSYDW